MTDRLRALIELARHYQVIPEEIRDQRISFAMGMSPWKGPLLTRESIEGAIGRMRWIAADGLPYDMGDKLKRAATREKTE